MTAERIYKHGLKMDVKFQDCHQNIEWGQLGPGRECELMGGGRLFRAFLRKNEGRARCGPGFLKFKINFLSCCKFINYNGLIIN